MPKNKPPVPRKNKVSSEDDEDAMVQQLCDLANRLAELQRAGAAVETEIQGALQKAIRKCLQRKQDDILYESLESCKYADIDAYRVLKDVMDETSAVSLIRPEQGAPCEINAFVIPVFARTVGGLHADQCCTDQEAFDSLRASIQQAGLESPDAQVVLIHYAYHLDEIDGITYSHLSEMIRDAYTSMTDKKSISAPAIDRSLGGWPDNPFQPGDEAVELRFLLGFALKAADDAFYSVPDGDAAMDAYFAERAARFRQWTETAAPLLKRLLAPAADGAQVDIHFLYQDLFHGGKERGIAEYFMLQMMSTLNLALDGSGCTPAATRAVIGPVTMRDELFLRVNVYRDGDDTPIASVEKPLALERDPEMEIEDVCDALATIGIVRLGLAEGFDEAGLPLNTQAVNAD
ncbi:MAG: hypothetical protein JWP38_3171 [Herbaspirillum sp.]|jgi:hypothetical protein|nr:hypothetical protein [Herbaspirillum sp.]